MTDTTFPAQPDQLTPEWLTDTLRAAAALGDDRSVTAIEITPVGAGTGLVGMVMRVHQTYGGGSAGTEPDSVVSICSATSISSVGCTT